MPDDYGQTDNFIPLCWYFFTALGAKAAPILPASIIVLESAGGSESILYIAQGQWPSELCQNPADGKSYKFIVVSPQISQGWSTSAPQLDYVLTSLYKTYTGPTRHGYISPVYRPGGEGVR